MNNPWKKLKSQEIYKNAWIRLREDKIIDPSGKSGIYGVVETSPALGVVPLTKNLNTFLVGQYRYTLDQYTWEIPEGGKHPDETEIEGAQRELLEETGLTAQKWTFLDTCFTSNSITNEVAYLYIAENLKQNASRPDSTEKLNVKELPFIHVVNMVNNFEIKDAMSIIAIQRAYLYLKNQGKL